MATQAPGDSGMVPTLGLTGVTINAMALIAPGAFLWTTFQTQSAAGGTSMWAAVFVAVLIALLTAIAYSSLSTRYPESGTGSAYYYAEAAILHKEEHRHFRFARLSKFVVGWASHIYYWIYPGVMVAFMALVLKYLVQVTFNNASFGTPLQTTILAVVFALIVGSIAYIGVTGSTLANIIINAVQIIALVTLGIVAIVFRLQNPTTITIGGQIHHYLQPTALSVLTPKNFNDLFFQSTIAILLVVGFESATALGAEAKNPKRDIPRGVILSLIIQGVIFYLFEYFATNFAFGDYYTNSAGSGFAAAFGTTTGAPVGDLAQYFGDKLFNGAGIAFAGIIAVTVVIALIGTALSCLNTGVRVSYAMGKDDELPAVFGFLHGRFRTPHVAIIILTVLSAIVGAYGALNADTLLQVELVSNIGTFILYGMTCIVCIIAFAGAKNRNLLTTLIAPGLGAILNIALLVGVIYFSIVGIAGGPTAKTDTLYAGLFSIAWLIIGFIFLFGRKMVTGVRILHPEDYKAKLASASESNVSIESGGD